MNYSQNWCLQTMLTNHTECTAQIHWNVYINERNSYYIVECNYRLKGNGICDNVNNFFTCYNYDGGDCRPPNIIEWPNCPHNPALIGDGSCDSRLKTKSECGYDFPDCCPNHESVGDGECNLENLNDLCMNDGGDCCNKKIGPGN